MNNTAGMPQAEFYMLMGLFNPPAPTREVLRSAGLAQPNKRSVPRKARRAKNRAARKSRARNRR